MVMFKSPEIDILLFHIKLLMEFFFSCYETWCPLIKFMNASYFIHIMDETVEVITRNIPRGNFLLQR